MVLVLVLLIFPLKCEFKWLLQLLTGVIWNSVSTYCFSPHNPLILGAKKAERGGSSAARKCPDPCRTIMWRFPAWPVACALLTHVTSLCCACLQDYLCLGRPRQLLPCHRRSAVLPSAAGEACGKAVTPLNTAGLCCPGMCSNCRETSASKCHVQTSTTIQLWLSSVQHNLCCRFNLEATKICRCAHFY